MDGQRTLQFSHLAEILREIEGLLQGHTTLGKWTLGQICDHLNKGLHYTAAGPPCSEEPTAKHLERRQRFFASPRFPVGVNAPAITEPGLSPDAKVQLGFLRDTIALFESRTTPFPAHPVLGPFSKAEWSLFHCRHCAHHLEFVVPK
jgi:hypothetical protein